MEASLLLVTFIISTLLHFGVQKLFIYYKRFDDFNHRSSHKTLATRTGGIGIFLTVLIYHSTTIFKVLNFLIIPYLFPLESCL